eukprot:GHVT01044417.1.p1 GENE.GHVT01044417.1~~GHVT01044417.1.p1  ORF type:complete len:147 (-),score=37.49 GHVT01044417.1:2157-2597(-)
MALRPLPRRAVAAAFLFFAVVLSLAGPGGWPSPAFVGAANGESDFEASEKRALAKQRRSHILDRLIICLGVVTPITLLAAGAFAGGFYCYNVTKKGALAAPPPNGAAPPTWKGPPPLPSDFFPKRQPAPINAELLKMQAALQSASP